MKAITRANACTGKRRYETRADAAAHLRAVRRRGRDYRGVLPYRCPFAAHWHVGHPPGHLG